MNALPVENWNAYCPVYFVVKRSGLIYTVVAFAMLDND